MNRRSLFPGVWTPWLFVAPQVLVTLIFFFWPAGEALWFSLQRQDAFGLRTEFVWFENFEDLWNDPLYWAAFETTFFFGFLVAFLSVGLGLALALAAHAVTTGKALYRTLLIWPYAIAPAVAAVIWLFLFNPTTGAIAHGLEQLGYDWNHNRKAEDAMTLVTIASVWRQVPYNFVFFLAGLQAIPRSLIEAAAIDGAGPWRRFRHVTLPMLSPVTFFLVVVNVVYAFFDTFAVIHATTDGGPGQATTTLVYKVFRDGNDGLDLGASGAQSVILILLVSALTVVQFRYLERRVHYA